MAEYHVGSGICGIYAGTINKKGDKWVNKSDVTDEAICAVRDYLKNEADMNKKELWGYEWDTKDGKTVELLIKIRDKDVL